MKVIQVMVVGMLTTVLVAAVAALYALLVVVLWNWLMPVIFHLPMITLWQAWGLTFLAGLLFSKNVSVETK